MKLVYTIIITALATYSTLAIFLPDIRLFYWRQTPKKFGAISYLGIALFLWTPVITMSGLMVIRHPSAWYCVALLGIVISLIGYVIDSV